MKFNKLSFFVFSCLIVVLLSSCTRSETNKQNIEPAKDIWQDGYFVQKSVVTPEMGDSVIKVQLDNEWKEFKIFNYPEKFIEWNISRRIKMINDMKEMIKSKDKNAKGPDLAGPHNGIVASYGFKRYDTHFKLNNAVKGMGFLPNRDKIKEIIAFLEETDEESIMKKMDILISNYEKADSLFDMDKQVSLELYSTPEFNTQTFLNQITNPISTVVFWIFPVINLNQSFAFYTRTILI